MKISIAMATYNGEKYLRAQLDSFLAQTLPPDELVICDDASSDATLSIATEFQARAPFPVRLYPSDKNTGYIRNFERALGYCAGEIIFLSDQDDVWLPGKVRRMVDEFASHPDAVMVQCDMLLADERLQPTGETQLASWLRLGFDRQQFVFGCCAAIRREFLVVALPVPASETGHDAWLGRLAVACDARRLIEEPLQFYRRHTGTASQTAASNLGSSAQTRAMMMEQLQALLADLRRNDRTNWQEETDRLEQAVTRLGAYEESLAGLGIGPDRLEVAQRIMRARIADYRHRLALVRQPRHRRLPGIGRFWLAGRYRLFSGWKSALKDLLSV